MLSKPLIVDMELQDLVSVLLGLGLALFHYFLDIPPLLILGMGMLVM